MKNTPEIAKNASMPTLMKTMSVSELPMLFAPLALMAVNSNTIPTARDLGSHTGIPGPKKVIA